MSSIVYQSEMETEQKLKNILSINVTWKLKNL